MKAVKEQFKENLFEVIYDGELPSAINEMAYVTAQKNGAVTVQLKQGRNSNDMLQLFLRNNNMVHSFQEILPTLNEIFIKKVGSYEEEVK